METKTNAEWQDVEMAVAGIAAKLDGVRVDSVVAIGRGGCIPAAMLAHRLGIKTVDYVNYSRKQGYLGDTLSRFDDTALLVFIDDATETGSTFARMKELYAHSYPRMVTAVLYARGSTMFETDDGSATVNYEGTLYEGDCPKMPWEATLDV